MRGEARAPHVVPRRFLQLSQALRSVLSRVERSARPACKRIVSEAKSGLLLMIADIAALPLRQPSPAAQRTDQAYICISSLP